MKLGIVGLPNAGESTLFNSLTKVDMESTNYPFCTTNPNASVVPVPDVRLDRLTAMYNPEKTTPVVIELVDIAGLIEDAFKGEGLGNQFPSSIREMDTIVHAACCFNDPNVIYVDGCINPLRNVETISLEPIFSDIEILERRIAKQSKGVFNNRDLVEGVELLKAIKAHLEDRKLVRSFEPNNDDTREFINTLDLLIQKSAVFAVSVIEDDFADDGTDSQYVRSVRGFADENNCEVSVICAETEQEIAELDDDERKMLLSDLGPTGPSLEELIMASHHILGLMSYLTTGPQENHAWTIEVGTRAPQAAGKIHSDSERGFIRAEVVNYDDLTVCGSMNAAKEKGLVCSEDKEYVMRDGDVALSRLSVQVAIVSQL